MTERAPAGEDRPTKMLLADDAPCPGRFIAVRNATAGICYGCARYGASMSRDIKPIEPAARYDEAHGEWVCIERRSAGHVPQSAPGQHAAESLGGITRPGDGCDTSSAARGLAA